MSSLFGSFGGQPRLPPGWPPGVPLSPRAIVGWAVANEYRKAGRPCPSCGPGFGSLGFGAFGSFQTQPGPNNTLQVSDGGDWFTPWPGQPDIDLFDRQVAQWAPLAIENEKRTGVPANWTLAIIHSESAGLPDAHGPPSDYGIGLMMITAPGLKQGLSNEEVFIPENNVRLGTDFIRTIMSMGGSDVAKVASMFNCGPGSGGPKSNPSTPYGYCEYKQPSGAYPYISKVVQLSNYAASQLAGGLGGGGAGSTWANVIALAAAGAIGWIVYDNRDAISDALGI